MQKATLQANILPTAKFRFLVSDLPQSVITMTRGELVSELGVINLQDQTRVAGGRQRAGDFEVEIQLGNPSDLKAYREWHKQAFDQPGKGIDPRYKRSATAKYLRLFEGTGGQYDASSDLQPLTVRLQGCWCSKLTLPKNDINADNGDGGDTILKATINYDSLVIED